MEKLDMVQVDWVPVRNISVLYIQSLEAGRSRGDPEDGELEEAQNRTLWNTSVNLERAGLMFRTDKVDLMERMRTL